MNTQVKVNVSNVSKVYSLSSKFSFKKKYFMALDNISFQVKSGESIGIFGLNGSGKSTLSNLLAHVNKPTKGSVEVHGKSRLIAISAGLNQELNGYENIKLKCLMHGLNKKQVDDVYRDIIEFSEIEEFLQNPIKTYSSGMKSKLGFAIAIHTNPDILIIDEALSVGDATFADKCLKKIKKFQSEGKTIFFVSHSAKQVESMCDKAIWIDYGKLKAFGDIEDVMNQYNEYIRIYNSLSKIEKKQYQQKMFNSQIQSQPIVTKNINKHGLFKWGLLTLSTVGFLCTFIFQILSI